jgi:O-antigen/teichoic acid export membrane protein
MTPDNVGTLTPEAMILIGLICMVLCIIIWHWNKKYEHNDASIILFMIFGSAAFICLFGGAFYYSNVYYSPAPGYHHGWELITGEI